MNDIPHGTLNHGDGTSEELRDSEPIDEENGSPKSSNTPPPEHGSDGSRSDSADQPPPTSTEVDSEDSVETAPPADDDQDRCPPEIVGHPEGDSPEEKREGPARAGKPPKSNREPREITGRRGRQSPKQTPEQRSQPPPDRPELICRRSPASTTWEIVLTADEECQLVAVQFEGEQLGHGAQGCHVPAFTGSLTVSYQDGKRHNVPLFVDDPLIFKLRKNWSGEGRKINRITSGHNIIGENGANCKGFPGVDRGWKFSSIWAENHPRMGPVNA